MSARASGRRKKRRNARLLIERFDTGQLAEVKNGTSLRSLLSKKLFCSPMRITKKYAGQGIGKKVYISKMAKQVPAQEEGTGIVRHQQPPPSYQFNVDMFKIAEAKFLASAFPPAFPQVRMIKTIKLETCHLTVDSSHWFVFGFTLRVLETVLQSTCAFICASSHAPILVGPNGANAGCPRSCAGCCQRSLLGSSRFNSIQPCVSPAKICAASQARS